MATAHGFSRMQTCVPKLMQQYTSAAFSSVCSFYAESTSSFALDFLGEKMAENVPLLAVSFLLHLGVIWL